MTSSALDDDALVALRLAAQEVSWLIGRGYPPSAVGAFVSQQRELGDAAQLLLAVNARLGLEVKHHIARELDGEDVSRRPLKIDTASLVAVVAAGLRGGLLLENGAGVLCDPGWVRTELHWDDALPAALDRCAAALKKLRPKTCAWQIDRSFAEAGRLEAAVGAAAKKAKVNHTVAVVDDVVGALNGAPFVVSNDPAILDQCGTWLNLAPLALEGVVGMTRLQLEG